MTNRYRVRTGTRSARAVGVAVVLAACVVAGCSSASNSGHTDLAPAATAATPADATTLTSRLMQIDEAINSWQSSPDLAAARASAETARNLVVGPDGPYYGDADGEGTIEGVSDRGLLPGVDGQSGIATEAFGACVTRDVLGGSWGDPQARWAELDDKIAAWSPTNNPFPTLASHPQRIVGWATLAINATTLDEALEYAGHAHLHIDVAQQAVTACSG